MIIFNEACRPDNGIQALIYNIVKGSVNNFVYHKFSVLLEQDHLGLQ